MIRLIWLNPGISRVEMADQLGLNRSTVTNIVGELLELGLVRSVALGDSTPLGGRKKVQLAIDPGFGCVGGIQIHADEVRLAVVDLAGRVLHHQAVPGGVDQRSLHRRLAKASEIIRQRARRLDMRLLGIGCGVPGICDPERGVLLQSIPLGIMHEVPIAEPLSAAAGVPIFVDNDANCCAWGEIGPARRGADHFLFVLGEWRRATSAAQAAITSIGLGVVIHRKVHHGRGFSAGEFRSIFWRSGNASQFSFSDAEVDEARGDRRRFLALARELARNVALVVHVLDLDRVYLGGFFDPRDLELRGLFVEEIARNWTYPTPPACEVVFSSHGAQAVVYGAASLVLERVFVDTPDVGQEPGLTMLMQTR